MNTDTYPRLLTAHYQKKFWRAPAGEYDPSSRAYPYKFRVYNADQELLGEVLTRNLKDVIPFAKRMRGRYVRVYFRYCQSLINTYEICSA